MRSAPRRETRYFATWKRRRQVEEHGLPAELAALTGQATCPIGDAGALFLSLARAFNRARS